MLHLAQVQNQGMSGEVGLRLLARQDAEYMWELMTEEVIIPTEAIPDASNAHLLSEGLLTLVELSQIGEILSLQDATNWVLELMQIYLTSGITPAFLQQEAERAEKWRQTLTLQNQELARRLLELEARREQIEALEESFKRDKEESWGS
jgi:DNA-binding transcriptional MerR regulator